MLLPRLLVDALLQALGVGDEQVVADELHLVAQLVGQLLPAGPVVLGQAVLDRADRPLGAQLLPQVDHLVGGDDLVGLALEEAVAGLALLLGLLEQLGAWRGRGRRRSARRACSRPSRRPVASTSSASSLLLRFGAKPPSSPTAVFSCLSCSTFFRLWKTSAPMRSAFAEGRRADGHDHELLEVDVVVGVLAAVEDVHHRHGQDLGVGAAEVAVERQADRRRRRRGRRPATRRGWRWRRACPCSACRRARAAAGRWPTWSRGVQAEQLRGDDRR